MLRFVLWRLLAVLAWLLAGDVLVWCAGGGPGRLLRGSVHAGPDLLPFGVLRALARVLIAIADQAPPAPGAAPALLAALAAGLAFIRVQARRRRQYVRLQVQPYRTDRADAAALSALYDALHKRLLRRWWRRLLLGQPSVALEVHYSAGATPYAWWAVTCPRSYEAAVEAALRGAYPNCRLTSAPRGPCAAPVLLRLKKHEQFIQRAKQLGHFEQQREPPMNRLATAIAACGEPACVQLAMTPAPASFERLARSAYKHREARLSRERREHWVMRDRSLLEDAELKGALELQHRALFFVDLRVIAPSRGACERIAAELRTGAAENRLVERGTTVRHGILRLYTRRIRRGEGNPLPSVHSSVFASTELAAVWQLPSSDYATVPLMRSAVPFAPAPPSIQRVAAGRGTLRDAYGEVSIHVAMRKQNTAVPGTVEQGKSSYLTATVAEDLRRDRCAVILLDPKGDAADAALSLVPADRTCTLLDFSHPTCGFNPLAVDAPADVIADYVVAALKNLFTDVNRTMRRRGLVFARSQFEA